MNLHYKIVEIHEKDRTMVVRYFTDIVTEKDLEVTPNEDPLKPPVRCKSDLSLGIPLPEPTEEELHNYIIQMAPIQALQTAEKLKLEPKENIMLSVVKELKEKTFVKTEEELQTIIATPDIKTITDADIKNLLKEIDNQ